MGTPRTGSSLLAQLINFHPEVACGWQWTANTPWWNKLNTAQRGLTLDFDQLSTAHQTHMKEIVSSSTRQIGFRALFRSSDKWLGHPRVCPALWADRLEQHIQWIKRSPHISIIHIIREDNLAWLRSYIFSHMTHNYIGQSYQDGITVKISQREALARIRSKQWLDSQLSNLAKSNRYLRVQYESLCENKLATAQTVLSFLKCNPDDYAIDKDSLIKKQSRNSTRDAIENYNELVTALTNRDLMKTRFES